jgi:hypothetical protein
MSVKIEEAAMNLSDSDDLVDQMNQVDLSSSGSGDSVYWKQYQLEADTAIKPAIDAGIDGATDYKLQMDVLALYGEDLSVKQAALVQLSQQLIRLKLQQQVEQAQQERLNQYIEQMAANLAPSTEMMQTLYLYYLDQKIALFVALEDYNLSYKYWALRESSCHPSITGQVENLENNLTQIQVDYQNALESFVPPPQNFQNITVTVSDSQSLQAFAQNRTLALPISLSEPAFAQFDRVRVERVQVYLQGVHCTSPIYVQIETTGAYQDRYQHQNYQFVSDVLVRGFAYDPKDMSVLIDGNVSDETQYAYFEPTPFSTWKITLPDHEVYNHGLDLSSLMQIQFKFSGNLIIEKH